MNSSSETVPHPALSLPDGARRVVEPFIYRLTDEMQGEAAEVMAPAPEPGVPEEEVRRREAAAREAGRREAEARLQAEYQSGIGREHGKIAECLRDFELERRRYYQEVEREVVQLALSIARKILYREAQVDPMLLSGAVRVALDRLAGDTQVHLRVHPSQAVAWREFLGQQRELPVQPEVIADPGLEAGGCMLETERGATDLSLSAQLKEVEQVFQELLERRSRLE